MDVERGSCTGPPLPEVVLPMKISARNVMEGEVVCVENGVATSHRAIVGGRVSGVMAAVD